MVLKGYQRTKNENKNGAYTGRTAVGSEGHFGILIHKLVEARCNCNFKINFSGIFHLFSSCMESKQQVFQCCSCIIFNL